MLYLFERGTLMQKILAFILAGGKGKRLYPLTRDRAKPAVPFGAIYRIIDFTLSNCINSDIRKIYILTQYKSLSLGGHIQQGWNILNGALGKFITVVPAQQRVNEHWYKGTADAIYQNIYLLQKEMPELTLILSGDHVYKMDYRRIVDFHREKGADVTVASVEVAQGLSKEFGVIEVDSDFRITGFQEKPDCPRTILDKPDKILASMGIYVFNTKLMVKKLIEDAKKRTAHDFGHNIIPGMIKDDKVFAYNFVNEKGESQYWKDVGTLDAYYASNMDLVSISPLLNLYDPEWPIHTYHAPVPPAKTVFDENSGKCRKGVTLESIISGGCIISGGEVKRSLVSPDVRIESCATVEESILLEGVRVGENARIKRAIIDKYSKIPSGMEIGYTLEEDATRFTVTESGIVVVPRSFHAQ
jgi:glucose-1-phosphate adenylyltransferase